jgi:hypothetical protein
MAAFVREVAKRVFAQEFKESNLMFKDGEDQYSPQYLLTPTGAKVNRLFIVGTLTETEDIGTEAEFLRGRVSGPTGSFLIYAGQYQPEAAQVLSECEKPAFVAIVGKPNTYTTDEGDVITSVRPESISVVDGDTRDMWVLETAKHTINRINSLDKDEPNIKKAVEHYNTDKKHYYEMVQQALQSLKETE